MINTFTRTVVSCQNKIPPVRYIGLAPQQVFPGSTGTFMPCAALAKSPGSTRPGPFIYTTLHTTVYPRPLPLATRFCLSYSYHFLWLLRMLSQWQKCRT